MQVTALSYCHEPKERKQIYSGFSESDPLWYQEHPDSLQKVVVHYGKKSRTYYLGLAAQYLLNDNMQRAFLLNRTGCVNPNSVNEKGEKLILGKVAVKLGKMYPLLCSYLRYVEFSNLDHRHQFLSRNGAKIINTLHCYLQRSPDKLATISYRLYDLYQTIVLLRLYDIAWNESYAEIKSHTWEVIQEYRHSLNYTIQAFSSLQPTRKRRIEEVPDLWLFWNQPQEVANCPVNKKCCLEGPTVDASAYEDPSIEYVTDPALTFSDKDLPRAPTFRGFPSQFPPQLMTAFLQFRQKDPMLYCTSVIADSEEFKKELLIFHNSKKAEIMYLFIPICVNNTYSGLFFDINRSLLFYYNADGELLNAVQIEIYEILSRHFLKKIIVQTNDNLAKNFRVQEWMTGFCLIEFVDRFFRPRELELRHLTSETILNSITPFINEYVQFYNCYQLELPQNCEKLYRDFVSQFNSKKEQFLITKFQKSPKGWKRENLIICLIFMHRANLTEAIIKQISHTPHRMKILFGLLDGISTGREGLVFTFKKNYKQIHSSLFTRRLKGK